MCRITYTGLSRCARRAGANARWAHSPTRRCSWQTWAANDRCTTPTRDPRCRSPSAQRPIQSRAPTRRFVATNRGSAKRRPNAARTRNAHLRNQFDRIEIGSSAFQFTARRRSTVVVGGSTAVDNIEAMFGDPRRNLCARQTQQESMNNICIVVRR